MEKGVKIVRDPDRVMAKHLKKAIDHPSVEDFINIGDYAEIITLTLPNECAISDCVIKDIQLPKHSMIISIIRESTLLIPMSDGKLYSGDQITVLTKSDLVEEVTKIFSKLK